MSNPLSYNPAVQSGLEPQDYSYRDIPVGTYKAILDFKIWSNKVSGVDCFFTTEDSGEKILLTVYRDRTTREYTLKDLDFRECPVKTTYEIEVKLNSKGNPKFVKASIVE